MEAKQSKDERSEKFEQNDVQENQEILSAAIAGASTLLEDTEPEKSLGLRTSYWDFIHALEELKINGSICLLAAEGLDSGVVERRGFRKALLRYTKSVNYLIDSLQPDR